MAASTSIGEQVVKGAAEIKKVELAVDANGLPLNRILGSQFIPALYCNIYICAPKLSGKTTLVYNIMEACTDKKTFVYIICSTHLDDPTYLAMKEMMRKKHVTFECFTSLEMLQPIIMSLSNANKAKSAKNDQTTLSARIQQEMGKKPPPPVEKKRAFEKAFFPEHHAREGAKQEEESKREPFPKTGKIAADYIFVLDDIANQLSMPIVNALLKIQRHLRTKIIISSQDFKDLMPEAAMQIDYMLLLRGQNEERLKSAYERSDHHIEFPVFERLYRHATQEPFHFMFYNKRLGEYRHNFTRIMEIPPDPKHPSPKPQPHSQMETPSDTAQPRRRSRTLSQSASK
jgi:hypothetical protein